jgi:predicted nucleic acid-binding protein
MFLLDSNIVIYAADPDNPASVTARRFLSDNPIVVSILSMVETLGYHDLSAAEKTFLEAFYSATKLLSINDAVIDRAVELRQSRKMSLGDALIAATALTYGLTLVTRNTKDFAWIVGLTLYNPFDTSPSNGTHT